MTAPICFHLEIWSNIEFSFQKEDEVFKELTKVCCLSLLSCVHHQTMKLTMITGKFTLSPSCHGCANDCSQIDCTV